MTGVVGARQARPRPECDRWAAGAGCLAWRPSLPRPGSGSSPRTRRSSADRERAARAAGLPRRSARHLTRPVPRSAGEAAATARRRCSSLRLLPAAPRRSGDSGTIASLPDEDTGQLGATRPEADEPHSGTFALWADWTHACPTNDSSIAASERQPASAIASRSSFVSTSTARRAPVSPPAPSP